MATSKYADRGVSRNNTTAGQTYFNRTYPTQYVGSSPTGMGEYQQLFDNNPYRNLHYSESGWQAFLSGLGFRTSADKFREDAALNAAEYDAGIYSLMFQNEYNDEISKQARMRAAGENPDLLGTSGVSEAAQPLVDPNGMEAPAGEDAQQFHQVATTMLSCFSGAFQMASQFMQLQTMRNNIEHGSIENAGDMMHIIEQRVLGLTPAEGFQTDKEFNDWKTKVEATLRTNYGRSFFRGSSLRRWNRTIDDFIGGLPTSRAQFGAWNERLKNAKEYRYGTEDHWAEGIDLFRVVAHDLIELRNATTENKASAEMINSEAAVEEAGNELAYQQTIVPGEKARAENARYRAEAEGRDFAGILNEHLNKLGQRLDEFSKQGGFKGLLSEILLLLLSTRLNIGVGPNGANVGVTMPTEN